MADEQSPASALARDLNSRGNAQKQAGALKQAVASYRGALAALPDYPPSLYNLGASLRELGERVEAEICLRRVAGLDAADGDARFQLGWLLCEEARFAEAAGVLRTAAALLPDNPLLAFYLGLALVRSGDPWQAIGWFRKALEIEPDLSDASFNLGNAYSLVDERDQALECYRAALRARPADALYRGSLLNEMQHACDWPQLDELIAQQRASLAQQPPPPVHPFQLLSIPVTREEQLRCARAFAATLQKPVPPVPARATGDGRLRLGYLSADFHEHASAYLLAGLLEQHDRGRFETFAYSCGPEIASPMRTRLRQAFGKFVDVRALSSADAAAAIRADGIDILVDLKGYTLEARTEIVALRPAPVQVSFLGYPGTMGAPFIDYLVADRFIVPPAHEAGYSEALALLPGSYQPNDRRRNAGPAPARRALGLPAQAFVFCCFNQSYKILPDTFSLWMRLLQRVPGSVLWLLDCNAAATRNLRAAAQRGGVDPARLVFAGKLAQAAHLGRLAAADLFLDTFPCNAHTTASDALWMGLPVLTCSGETFASRVAGSLLHAAGLPELVSGSLADYEQLALRLAGDRSELGRLRARLAANRMTAPLFDTEAFTRHLETAYERMWQAHAAGDAPRRIVVGQPG